jgi:hypothetical protein
MYGVRVADQKMLTCGIQTLTDDDSCDSWMLTILIVMTDADTL